MVANVQSMFSASNVVPWHKRGAVIPVGADRQTAKTLSGLTYRVDKVPVHLPNGDVIPGKFATVRDDDGTPLDVVGKDYQVFQCDDMFDIGDVIAQDGNPYETGGVLGAGEKTWLLMKRPDYFEAVKGDKVDSFVLISNSFDGSASLRIFPTSIRVVCQNTLNVAIQSVKGQKFATNYCIRHTQTMMQRVETVKESLLAAKEQFGLLKNASQVLAAKQMNTQKVETFLKTLLKSTKGQDTKRVLNQREAIEGYFNYGTGNTMSGVKGSAWAMFNGVVEWVDYGKTTRKCNGTTEHDARTDSLLFGNGARLKQTAMDLLLKV